MFYFNEEINQFEAQYDFLNFIFMTGFSNISKNLYFHLINKNNQISNFEEENFNYDYFDSTYMIDNYSNTYVDTNLKQIYNEYNNKNLFKNKNKENDISPHEVPNLLDTIAAKSEKEETSKDSKFLTSENTDDDYKINSIIVERIKFKNSSTVNKEAKYKKISYHYDKLNESINKNEQEITEGNNTMRSQRNLNKISNIIKIEGSDQDKEKLNEKMVLTEPQLNKSSNLKSTDNNDEFTNFKVYNNNDFNEEDSKKAVDQIFFPEKYKYSKCSIL